MHVKIGSFYCNGKEKYVNSNGALEVMPFYFWLWAMEVIVIVEIHLWVIVDALEVFLLVR